MLLMLLLVLLLLLLLVPFQMQTTRVMLQARMPHRYHACLALPWLAAVLTRSAQEHKGMARASSSSQVGCM